MTWAVVWTPEDGDGVPILLDGHTRYAICQAQDLPFAIREAPDWVETRIDAKIWIIQNQFGRRNLEPFVKIELAEQRRPLFEAQAKANQGTRTDLRQNLAGSQDTKQAIADTAGVSRETVRKAEMILREADEPTKTALRQGERGGADGSPGGARASVSRLKSSHKRHIGVSDVAGRPHHTRPATGVLATGLARAPPSQGSWSRR